MQGYESVFITDPDLSDEALTGVLDKIKNTVTHQGGEVQQYHLWGRRRLAYLIKKKTHGVYHLLYITGGEAMLKELTQQYRFTEEIMRFQTIRVENIQKESETFFELYHKAMVPETAPPSEAVSPLEKEEISSADEESEIKEPSPEEPVAEEAETSNDKEEE